MAEFHHFTYGAFNPIAAYLLAFLGSFFGLLSTSRARAARSRGRRTRWLVIAALTIGGSAIWLMQFTALLGFEVPASPVRYDAPLTLISFGLAVGSAGAGLLIVGHGRPSPAKTALAGLITGSGLLATHYTGMQAIQVTGELHYQPVLAAASAVLAFGAATLALWFVSSVQGWTATIGAAAITAVALCGMHYTAMSAVRVELAPVGVQDAAGVRPLLMIVPITLISACTILAMALSALQAMTDEEFTAGAGTPRRGAHAEHPWSLRQASMASTRRPPDYRPGPRPVPKRPPAEAAAGS